MPRSPVSYVSVRLVQRGPRVWEDGGERALASRGRCPGPSSVRPLRGAEAGVGQEAGGARAAGSDKDAVADQDPLIGRRIHSSMTLRCSRRCCTAPARRQPPGPGPPRGGARQESRQRLSEGDLAPRWRHRGGARRSQRRFSIAALARYGMNGQACSSVVMIRDSTPHDHGKSCLPPRQPRATNW